MSAAYSTAFDAHTHLDDPIFDHDRDEVVVRAVAAGVGGYAIAGPDPEDWDRVVQVAAAHGGIAILGLHPWWAAELSIAEIDSHLADLARRATPHGLGETGLDRHRGASELERQRHAFRAQLRMSRERELPLVFHGAGIWAEVVQTVRSMGLSSRGGMAHAWTGSAQLAREAVDAGLSLSFGPEVRTSRRARESVPNVPRDRLLLETDAPARPVEGTRGEPRHLLRVAEEVATLRNEGVREVLAYTGYNARRLLGVPESR